MISSAMAKASKMAAKEGEITRILLLAFVFSFLSLTVEATSRLGFGHLQSVTDNESMNKDSTSSWQDIYAELISVEAIARRSSPSKKLLSWCVETCYEIATDRTEGRSLGSGLTANLLTYCVEICHQLTTEQLLWSAAEDLRVKAPDPPSDGRPDAPTSFGSSSDPPPDHGRPDAGISSAPESAPENAPTAGL